MLSEFYSGLVTWVLRKPDFGVTKSVYLTYLDEPEKCLSGEGNPCKMARLEGIEPPTDGLEIRCSIQLSYRRSLL